MFNLMAFELCNTLESIATPCSVNAIGAYLAPPHFEVPDWHLKISISSLLISNMKS